jgi:hypothetical protein
VESTAIIQRVFSARLLAMPQPMQLVSRTGGTVTNVEKHPARPIGEQQTAAILLRLEQIPATPANLVRIRERIRSLNQRLAELGAPFRLRLI